MLIKGALGPVGLPTAANETPLDLVRRAPYPLLGLLGHVCCLFPLTLSLQVFHGLVRPIVVSSEGAGPPRPVVRSPMMLHGKIVVAMATEFVRWLYRRRIVLLCILIDCFLSASIFRIKHGHSVTPDHTSPLLRLTNVSHRVGRLARLVVLAYLLDVSQIGGYMIGDL